jgi:hypothetical protein
MSFDWKNFLAEFSLDLLQNDEIRESLPEKVIESGWMGFSGATEEEIGDLENRLGVRLPNSYRNFLKISNGWRNTGYFINRVWSTKEVAWFRERHSDWIQAYLVPYRGTLILSDEDYLVYDDRQDSAVFRVEYLKSALEISDIGDDAIYLLNPEIKNTDGEWEAWLFSNWNPGAVRYQSFLNLMQAERHALLEDI